MPTSVNSWVEFQVYNLFFIYKLEHSLKRCFPSSTTWLPSGTSHIWQGKCFIFSFNLLVFKISIPSLNSLYKTSSCCFLLGNWLSLLFVITVLKFLMYLSMGLFSSINSIPSVTTQESLDRKKFWSFNTSFE